MHETPGVESISLQELISRIISGVNLEVVGYEGEAVIVSKVRGIVKGEFSREELGEIAKRRPRGRATKRQLMLAAEIARRLGEARKPFKVVFGPREVTIRAGAGFLRIYKGEVRVAGFRSLEEDPLPLIIDLLRQYGEVRLLRPLK
jgi:hypothetical protein